jgi:integrase
MTAANEDRIIPRNPCQVRGADKEQPQERPVLTVAEVTTLADAMPARFRVMILPATFASLRFGEVTALERRDVDLVAGTVRVRRTFAEVRGEGLVPGPPKSQAGRRTVSVPPTVVEGAWRSLLRTRQRLPNSAALGGHPAVFPRTGVRQSGIRDHASSVQLPVATVGATRNGMIAVE